MFVKPLSIILVYILTVINFLILTIPFIIIFTPLILLNEQSFRAIVMDFLSGCAVLISFVMMLYLALDLMFGLSIRSLIRDAKAPRKYFKKYKFMKKIDEDFHLLRKKFRSPNITLLISQSGEINAFAVGCLRAKYIVLTFGLLKHYQDNCYSEEEFHSCVKAIMAHEISHVINKDYLPALLLIMNDKAINLVSGIMRIFFNIFIRMTRMTPFIGRIVYSLLSLLHNLTNRLIHSFYNYVVYPIYNFIKLHLGRQIEYRCDKQAALACTGNEMALALSMLGGSGYMTIFSSHPKTRDRVKYVENIKHSKKKLSSSLINKLSNSCSILILVGIFSLSYQNIDVNFYKSKIIQAKHSISNVRNSISDLQQDIANIF